MQYRAEIVRASPFCEADTLNLKCTSLEGLRSLLRDGEQRVPSSLKSVDQVWECDLQLLREGEQIGFGNPMALTAACER